MYTLIVVTSSPPLPLSVESPPSPPAIASGGVLVAVGDSPFLSTEQGIGNRNKNTTWCVTTTVAMAERGEGGDCPKPKAKGLVALWSLGRIGVTTPSCHKHWRDGVIMPQQ